MNIDILSKVRKTEAPPFLYTRIEQRLANLSNNTMPKNVVWALSVAFAILLFTNIYVLKTYSTDPYKTESLAESIYLLDNNMLYK